MKTWLRNRVLPLLLLFASILVGALAMAGTKVTEKPLGWRVIPGDAAAPVLKTHDECVAAATARGAGDFTCTYSAGIKVELTCDDVPKPVLPTKINADGFMEQPGVVVKQLPGSTEWGPNMMEGYVHSPTWATGVPPCWVIGLVPYQETVPAPDAPPQGANDMSPSPWAYTEDPEWLIGGKCPSTDPNLCYSPPHPPIPPAS